MLAKGLQLGHYRLLQPIGSGGMGEVYLAEDIRITRQVAIKVVHSEPESYPDKQAQQETARLFYREMRAISMLDHPNILHLIDFGEQTVNEIPLTYMIMPYRQEGSLADWLKKRSEKLSINDTANLISQAAEALQHAHDHQLVHQDVKPSNFLLRNRPHNLPDLLLTDFGISRLSTANATASQNVRGTPAFMAPEQWQSQPVFATDQYALAVMAYLLLTGHTPFVGRMEQVMHQHFMIKPQLPSTYNADVPPALDAVILHALAKKPDERFSSVTDFAHAFRQAAQNSGELRTTLTINQAEALAGNERPINLPGGRRLTVKIPSNAQEGQRIRINGQGEQVYDDGPRGPLIITIAISKKDLPSMPGIEQPISNPRLPAIETASVSNPRLPVVEPTQPVSNPYLPKLEYAYPPSDPYSPGMTNGQTASDNKGTLFPASKNTNSAIASLQKLSTRTIVLAGLALLIALGSIFSFTAYQNHIIADNISSTATAHSHATASSIAKATSAVSTAAATQATTIAVATSQVVRANPYPIYIPGTGDLAIYDTLSQPNNWENESDNNFGSNCSFTDGGYHISQVQPRKLFPCNTNAAVTDLSDFVFEVQMTIIKGDCGGVNFRVTGNKFYTFLVCRDKSYSLILYTDNTSENSKTLRSSNSSNIQPDSNLIAVLARGSTLDLYVNSQKIDSDIDNTYSHGQIGLLADDHINATEIVYKNAKVWKI